MTTAIGRGDSTTPVLARLKDQGLSGEEARSLERSAAELSRVDALLRRYVGRLLADRLRADPSFSDLGGREREVTVLFADLAGFTSFCEGRSPAEIIEMVNAYWERAVPAVASEGGLVKRFAGDAILVVFNALGDQPDHAERAAGSARGIRLAIEGLAREHPQWPRFRIGVNTGPVVIGNVGAEGQRSLAALGDTTNVAARLQAAAHTGQILISRSTRERLPSSTATARVGSLPLKGREEAVEALALDGD